MNKPKVLGKNVYISLPEEDKKSKIIVDENTKDELNKQLLKKMSKLQVWAVGEGTTVVEVGDWVLVNPEALSRAKMVEFDDGVIRALVLDYDIIHIWP
jgi:hypothetical protein